MGPAFDAVGRTEAARPLSSPRMGTASRSTAAPATMPHSLRAARHIAPAVATVAAGAVLLRLVYEPWFLNYDARYALLWARDVAHGLIPDYASPYAPTPHPLETAVSLLAVPFGQSGDAIMLWLLPLRLHPALYVTHPPPAPLSSCRPPSAASARSSVSPTASAQSCSRPGSARSRRSSSWPGRLSSAT